VKLKRDKTVKDFQKRDLTETTKSQIIEKFLRENYSQVDLVREFSLSEYYVRKIVQEIYAEQTFSSSLTEEELYLYHLEEGVWIPFKSIPESLFKGVWEIIDESRMSFFEFQIDEEYKCFRKIKIE